MAKRIRARQFFGWFLVVLIIACAILVMRQGWLPARYTPLPAIDLANPDNWFVDWRLAELRYERGLCRSVMIEPVITASPIRDKPLQKGCGWVNAVRIKQAGGIRISVGRISCQAGAALALWLAHDVQPLAKKILQSPVRSISHLGTYSCRNIIGRKFWRKTRSQHATANAIDIASFKLKDGRRISVKRHWNGDDEKARFLHEVHARACRYFRVSLSPDFNAAHHDHFHFDRGPLSRCK